MQSENDKGASLESDIEKKFLLYYQNCRGICTKQNIVYPALLSSDYDIVVFTETWLTCNHSTNEFFPDKFDTYRCDRKAGKKGGGVSISLNRELSEYEQVIFEKDEGLEYVCVKIKNGPFFTFIYALYVPPITANDFLGCNIYERHIGNLESINRNDGDIFVLVGDFNLPKIKWAFINDDEMDNMFLMPYDFPNNLSSSIVMSILSEGLCQLNSVENIAGNILDLFFTSDPGDMKLIEQENAISLPIDNYHTTFVVEMSLVCPSVIVKPGAFQTYDFKNAPCDLISDYFLSVDFDSSFNGSDINDSIDFFYGVVGGACENFIDKISIDSKKKSFPWENDFELRNLKNRRRKYKKRMQTVADFETEQRYKRICSDYDNRYKLVYSKYIMKTQEKMKENPRKFWELVDIKRANRAIPDELVYNDKIAKTAKDCSSLFAQFFNSVYRSSNRSLEEINNLISNCNNEERYQVVEDDEILQVLLRIKVNKGKGPDLFPPLIYKNCAIALTRPIKLLIEKSLNVGYFPDRLKISHVSPIFKSGSKKDASNYRSVSVVSTLARIFENVVLNRITSKLSECISRSQHGFIRNRSTVTNLLETTTFVANALENRSQVDIVYLDFEKAFDSVNHFGMMEKLVMTGLDKNILFWLFSFISGRANVVKLCGAFSAEYSPTSGVPAGCSLSSVLFNIFINDITECARGDVFLELFADDVKVMNEVKNCSDCVNMQLVLDNIEQWSTENDLPMNVNKVKVLSISKLRSMISYSYMYKNVQICKVGQQKDLGVIFDSNFNFNTHIESMSSKAFVTLGFVKRFSKNFSIECKKMLYCSLVRSKLEYASQVWAPYEIKYIQIIERVQKKFSIWALNLQRDNETFRYLSYDLRLEQLKMDSLQKRRTIGASLWMYDLISGSIDSLELSNMIVFNEPQRRLRNTSLFKLATHRATYLRMQPIQRMLRFINVISVSFVESVHRSQFKFALKNMNMDVLNSY